MECDVTLQEVRTSHPEYYTLPRGTDDVGISVRRPIHIVSSRAHLGANLICIQLQSSRMRSLLQGPLITLRKSKEDIGAHAVSAEQQCTSNRLPGHHPSKITLGYGVWGVQILGYKVVTAERRGVDDDKRAERVERAW